MQWGSSARSDSQTPIENPLPVAPVNSVVPVIVPAETPTAVTPEVEPSEEPVVSSPSTIVDPNLPTKITDKVIHYENQRFRYAFDMPGNVYFSGFGSSDGALHTVGIGKEDPATLADAPVRVYFYGKKVVPELEKATNNIYRDPEGKYVYLLIKNEYSVKIEALNINHPVVQKIIETIQII